MTTWVGFGKRPAQIPPRKSRPTTARDAAGRLETTTDPSGNVTTFERSKFVDPDTGETAIGPGGGTVEGPDGMELRIPEGAVDRGLVFKLTSFGEEAVPEPFGGFDDQGERNLSFGQGLTVEIEGSLEPFKKEVDLAFKVPAEATENTVYYVMRRLENGDDPDGEGMYETIDEAFVEGEGDEARVVTASWPFSGYKRHYAAFTNRDPVAGAGGGASLTTAFSYNILLAQSERMYRTPVPGIVAGKVHRTDWAPGASSPTYTPISGVTVIATKGGDPPQTVMSCQLLCVSGWCGMTATSCSFVRGVGAGAGGAGIVCPACATRDGGDASHA